MSAAAAAGGTPGAPTRPAAEKPPHAVHFYETDDVLFERVADFLAPAFQDGDSVVIIATAAHREAFAARLRSRGHDPDAAATRGQLTFQDAEETLARFMVGETPDWQLFEQTITGILRQVTNPARPRRVRAYGEMVDLLWRGGNPQGALRVEEMWNRLGATLSFDLLCGYAMGNFYATPGGPGVRDICATHTHVLPAESQRVEHLVAEIAERKELEKQLRHAVRALRDSEERAQILARRMSDLQEVTAALGTALTIDDVVERFLALTVRPHAAAAGVVYLADSGGEFRVRGAHGVPAVTAVLPPDVPLPLTDALRSRTPVWVDRYDALIARYPNLAAAKTPPAKLQAVAALPLVQGGQLLGGVVLTFDAPRSFDDDEQQWLARLASQLALAAARACAYAAEQEARAEAQTLLRVAASLNASQLDLDAIVQRVTDEATAAVGAQFGAFFYNTTDADGESYVLFTLSGAPREAFAKFGLPRNTPVFAPTFHGERIIRLGDVKKDANYGQVGPYHGMPKGHPPVTSYLAVPVLSRDGSVIGGLFFGHPEADRFTEQHERLVAALAANAAAAIDNARLYQTTRDAEQTHRDLVEELTQTVKVNETLAGVLAHDLRNPLNAISTGAQLALARTDSEALTKPLSRIVASTERMSRMVEQLLDLARIRIGEGMPLDPKECDLDPVLRHVIDELDRGSGEESIGLELAGATTGRWDADRLAQVFSNLIGNAIQHRSGGAVRVSFDGTDPDRVRVTVCNAGAIPASLIPNLFEPLVSGERRRDRARGLGLGLFITQQIARGHGGRVDVQSSETEGTTFAVTLPRIVERATPTLHAAAPRPLREAKERVWQTEQRMRLLVDSIRDCAIYMLDPEGRVSSWNTGAERLKGFKTAEVLGKHFSIFFPPEHVAAGRPDEELRQARAAGTLEAEGWRVRKDGTRFWANVMIGVLRDTAGALIGYYKVTRDLTERRLAQEELRESENRLRLIVDGVKDYAIYMLDPDGNVRTWNSGAQHTKGYLPHEIIGKHFSTFFTPEARAAGRPQALLATATAQGRVEDEAWRVRKDGTTFWADVVITALRDASGALVGFAKVVRDLTERRRTEEQIRRSEERFRLMVDAVKDYAIFMLDPTGHVSTWNAGAERLKYYRADEIIGQHFSRFYPEEVVRAGVCEHELTVAASEGRFEDEGWRLRKDGTRFWANVVITALRGREGNLLGFTKVTRDLTARRKLEEERVQLAQAQEAIRLRDEFLSLVSHELKTPLAGLQMQLETLQEKIDTFDAKVAQKLQRATASGNRLADLIESLLDVSRIATGRFDLSTTTLDIVELVNGVVEGLRPIARKAGCELLTELAAPVVGRWDRVRIEQVVTNLLSNATKYGAGRPVVVSVQALGADVLLRVRDHGPGIDMTDAPRLFDRFERASSTRHYGGLGLGLYLVREIVEAHGGAVTAENAPGGGASFTVRLPLEPLAGARESDRGRALQ